jgi:hypothetical protein
MKTFKMQGQSGESLPSLMISAAILGIAVLGYISTAQQSNRFQSKAVGKRDMESFKNYVLSGLSCTKTIAAMPGGCTNGTAVTGLSSNGDEIFKADGSSVIGKYNIRGVCDTTGGIRLEYAEASSDIWDDLLAGETIQCAGLTKCGANVYFDEPATVPMASIVDDPLAWKLPACGYDSADPTITKMQRIAATTPILITTAAQLRGMQKGRHYRLQNNITLPAQWAPFNIGAVKSSTANYMNWLIAGAPDPAPGAILRESILDGNGFTIYGLSINQRAAPFVPNTNGFANLGLFHSVECSIIKNVTIESPRFQGFGVPAATNYVGALAGHLLSSYVENVTINNPAFENEMNFSNGTGGIAGLAHDSTIRNSRVLGGRVAQKAGIVNIINAPDGVSKTYGNAWLNIGGAVGQASGLTVLSNVNVTSEVDGFKLFWFQDAALSDGTNDGLFLLTGGHTAGGLIGIAKSSSIGIFNSNFSGSITDEPNAAGGAIGATSCSIVKIDNFSTNATLNSTHWSGGVLGYSYLDVEYSIKNTSLTGIHNSTMAGGVVGGIDGGGPFEIDNVTRSGDTGISTSIASGAFASKLYGNVSILNSSLGGNITSGDTAGGLVGFYMGGYLKVSGGTLNPRVTGNIKGKYAGFGLNPKSNNPDFVVSPTLNESVSH